MELDDKRGVLRRKNYNELIEYIQKARVIHTFTKILYSNSITMSEQILIEDFSEAWKKYKFRNADVDDK